MRSRIRSLNSLKVWSAIIGVALTVALVLTFLPFGVGINTDGLLSISLSQVGANPGWLSEWGYRKSHNLTGATGAGTDYQVSITVHSGSGSDSGDDVYLDSH